MANQYTTSSGVLLTTPGAYVQTKVQSNSSGLATTGVVVLVGEAERGPDFSVETDISQNWFGPGQLSAVLAKYGSGRLVDAFNAAVASLKDPDIQGAPSRIYMVKTNQSTKAQATLARSGMTAYGILADTSYGDPGNNLYFSIADSVSEVAPTTGPTTFIPTPSGATLSVRVNGAAAATLAVAALTTGNGKTPGTMVGSITTTATGLNSLSGILATGGKDRGVITGLNGITLAVAASGNNITVTLGTGSWATTPSVGDTLLIGGSIGDYGVTAGSVIKGAASANAGAYVVTAASASTITATKLRNNAAGTLTAPVNVSAVAISATPSNDMTCWSPIVVQNATGKDRGLLVAGNVGANVAGTLSGGNLVITLASGSWNATPQAGDLAFIPATAPSAIASAAAGWYTVVTATTTTMTLSRLSDDRTASTFSSTALAATTDIQVLRPSIDGLGKSLELTDGGGTDNVSTLFYALSTTPVTWLSTSSSPQMLRSASERTAAVSILRNSDNVNDSFTAGGPVALLVGYKGTTATLTISSTTISTTVSGGVGAGFSWSLSGFKTIGDLVAKLAAQPGYTAAVASSLYAQFPVTALDEGTWSICSGQAQTVAGIKKDAYDFFKQLTASSSHVQLGATAATNVAASSGLPDNVSSTFLAGGAKGATTAAQMVAAFAACEKIRGNFIVPLMSRDATADIADGLTDSGSTYTIAAIHAGLATHCFKMSLLQRRRPRQGFASIRDTFANAQKAAQDLAAARVSCNFQDTKAVATDGTITQFQPWYTAALAAGAQAACFYQPIFNKLVNCSGIIQAAGDFLDTDGDAVDRAIEAGLMVMKQLDTGGFSFASDKTTYSVDDNFVYNSVQAVYVADTIAMTLAQDLERKFVGKSLADVSAAIVVAFIKGIVAKLRRLKLVTSSDGAPDGYANLTVQILGPAIAVEISLVEATGVYFIPVQALIQQVQQSASA